MQTAISYTFPVFLDAKKICLEYFSEQQNNRNTTEPLHQAHVEVQANT